ncbi:hypothetical protein K469DRAFT_770038 [Zopfia rhizophila CBS 207.26]|uniref:FAD-binding domain-containing protein n=1 Tax=Zopfia rhizophila CBS 207.26 TaxID=1314779 RepID=A0A6A6E7S2_9PEZI|nr:hypothetical protein K469DRAFT_770038 [Zopfia rhizophila CBS 207.26]
MVACDGNRSPGREKLGISVREHELLSQSLTIYFKADVSKYVPGKHNGVIYINNPLVRGFIRNDKTGKQWFSVANTAGEQGTEERRFRRIILLMNELANTFVLPLMQTLISKLSSLQNGAQFMIAPLPSTKAPSLLGMQGTISPHMDAHNLAWKLVLVLKVRGEELVEVTYTAQRHPVARKAVTWVLNDM